METKHKREASENIRRCRDRLRDRKREKDRKLWSGGMLEWEPNRIPFTWNLLLCLSEGRIIGQRCVPTIASLNVPSLIFPTSFGPNQGVSLANFRDPIIAPPRPSSNGFSNQPGAVFSIYQRKGLTLLILSSRFDIVSVWRRRKREIERN